MKKTLALVLAAVMLLSLLSACKSSADETPTVDPAETEQTTTPEETTPAEEQTQEEPQPSQEELPRRLPSRCPSGSRLQRAARAAQGAACA